MTRWSEFRNPCKQTTKQYILHDEQHGLCIYCERHLSASYARLEHLKPQSCYPDEHFSYKNLVVSCHGQEDHNEMIPAHQGYSIDSCDHFKAAQFDENLFLDPTLIPDITKYFCFDKINGGISASIVNKEKANHMIQLLNLDNVSLCNERLNAKIALIRVVSQLPQNKKKKAMALLLQKDNKAFISFLRYCFP
jgi:uncharacterized protein (TIGR02646 family)